MKILKVQSFHFFLVVRMYGSSRVSPEREQNKHKHITHWTSCRILCLLPFSLVGFRWRCLALTSVVKHPPHINGAFSLFVLELNTGLHQLLVHLGNLWWWRAAHRHWKRRAGYGKWEARESYSQSCVGWRSRPVNINISSNNHIWDLMFQPGTVRSQTSQRPRCSSVVCLRMSVCLCVT